MGKQPARLSHPILANVLRGTHANVISKRAKAVTHACATRQGDVGNLDGLGIMFAHEIAHLLKTKIAMSRI